MEGIINNFRGLIVHILKHDEFQDVIRGVLQEKVPNIEANLSHIFTIIRSQCGFSRDTFDTYVYDNLRFLNDLLCLQFIFTSKFYETKYKEIVDKYPIEDKYIKDNFFGSTFNLRCALNEEFENLSLRPLMKFYKVPGRDETIAVRGVTEDAHALQYRTYKK